MLGRCHAAVTLTASAKLVKAHPHSLLEALAAGRPVLVSPRIALAELVGAAGAGELVGELTPAALAAAVDRLEEAYDERRRAAAALDLTEFDSRRFVERYAELYRDLGLAVIHAGSGR